VHPILGPNHSNWANS